LGILLKRANAKVHVVDNLTSNPLAPERLLAELNAPARLTFDVCSIADYVDGGPGAFDAIVHLASPVGPAGVLKHGGRIVSAVVNDCYLLADYAIEHGARLLNVSTSEVYGGGRDGLCDENDAKIVPAETSFRLEYAIAKLAAETALINLNARDGLNVVTVRPFNIAGPRQSGEAGFVVPRFLAQAMLGLPMTIFGTGKARRAFTHVYDMATGIVNALERGTAGVAYNLGNHRNIITVDELADVVLEVTGSDVPKEYVEAQDVYGANFAEANDKFPAVGRASSELDWNPTRNVRAVVIDAFNYFTSVPPEDFRRLAGTKVIEQLLETRTVRGTGSQATSPEARQKLRGLRAGRRV
jgi:nucleoside-diphosphate-sugar epimerase